MMMMMMMTMTATTIITTTCLRRIFEPKREEVTGGWGILHTEEIYNLVFHEMLLE